MIFVNFKAYEEGVGQNALPLLGILEEVAASKQIKIIPCVGSLDLKNISQKSKLEVWIQNVDPVDFGAHTGSTPPAEALEAGAAGTLLNHSEHRFKNFEDLKNTLQICKEINLKTLIFAANLEELEKVAKLHPDYVSYEPPELIGSTTTSVATAQPEIVAKAVEIAKKEHIPLIVGAGIHSREDVRKSLELGASGVAVASDIVKADSPKKELLDLVEGFL